MFGQVGGPPDARNFLANIGKQRVCPEAARVGESSNSPPQWSRKLPSSPTES